MLSGAGMAAASGSTLGISFAMGRIGSPEMLRANYSPGLATGTVAMAGTLKMLIPRLASPLSSTRSGQHAGRTPAPRRDGAGDNSRGPLDPHDYRVGIAGSRARSRLDLSGYTASTRIRAILRAWPLPLLALTTIAAYIRE